MAEILAVIGVTHGPLESLMSCLEIMMRGLACLFAELGHAYSISVQPFRQVYHKNVYLPRKPH